jgi:type IV pilus assembly protein PilB
MTGYKGRIGLYEAILTDENIEKCVINNPSERDIRNAARNQGLFNLQQDGIIKVVKGITSIEELERVVDLDDIE